MPEKALSTLEYEKVVERLARRCYTERGRALAAGLTPSSDYAEVLHRQRLTADTRRLEFLEGCELPGVAALQDA